MKIEKGIKSKIYFKDIKNGCIFLYDGLTLLKLDEKKVFNLYTSRIHYWERDDENDYLILKPNATLYLEG